MITKHSTSFTVYPDMCNYMNVNDKPMVHGGYMLMMMDRVSAECSRRLLYSSPTQADSAVTVSVTDVTFFVGALLGDIIFLEAEVVKLGNKRIEIQVTGFRESCTGSREKICEGKFIFVSRYGGDVSMNHGLVLKEKHE